MDEEQLPTIAEIYSIGKENLERAGVKLSVSLGNYNTATSIESRKYLDTLFFRPHFIDTVEADTSITLFSRKLKAPIFCSAVSALPFMSKSWAVDIGRGIAKCGSLMMLGIGGSDELQSVIDTGAPVIKIVKPYRSSDLIYNKVRDAETRGCVAVGMDIDHALGRLNGDRLEGTAMRGPQRSEELKQLISQTKLPFIIKGVLNVSDAQKAIEIGASAIVVSNHSANSFLFGLPSAMALPAIVDVAGKKLTVLVDSGFASGIDALKGLALGAKAVGFGFPVVAALMADGSRGIELLFNQIAAQLKHGMTATGCSNVAEINKSILFSVT